MANSDESNPLLPIQEQEADTKYEKKSSTGKNSGAPPPAAIPIGWTADGLPVGDPTMERSEWDSGLLSCLGRNDEFCSSDLEVCEFFFFSFCLVDEFISAFQVKIVSLCVCFSIMSSGA